MIWHAAKIGNVLANDSDPDAGDSLTVTQFSFGGNIAPAGGTLEATLGTLTLESDGDFHYVATSGDLALGESAFDAFTYTVSDTHAATASTNLTFTVTATPLSNLIGTQVHDPSSPAGIVYRLYDTLLDREPDPTGLQAFVDALQNGVPPAQIVEAILNSDEFFNRHGGLSNAEFVASLYQDALNRDPDSGAQGWIDFLNGGGSRALVALGISDSAEHQDITGDVFTSGIFVPNETAFQVSRLYHELLGRAPDADGLTAGIPAVQSGVPLSQLAQGMIDSFEFQNVNGPLDNHDYVDLLFHNALGRDVDDDPAGLPLIDALVFIPRSDLAVGVSESPEAKAHLAPFIDNGLLLS